MVRTCYTRRDESKAARAISTKRVDPERGWFDGVGQVFAGRRRLEGNHSGQGKALTVPAETLGESRRR